MSASGSTVASLSGVRPVTSLSTYQQLVGASTSSGRALVLLFTAEWHPPCKQMRLVCDALANQLQTASGVAGPLFGEVDAESVSEVTELFGDAIASVPTTLVLRAGKVVDQVQGASAQELTAMVQKHARVEAGATPAPAAAATVAAAPATAAAASASAEAAAPSESKEDLDARLYKLVRASPVMAFIKGTPSAPRCGFTRKLLELLQAEQIQVGTFDILEDKVVREGLKAFSNWPTYPQLYVGQTRHERAARQTTLASAHTCHVRPVLIRLVVPPSLCLVARCRWRAGRRSGCREGAGRLGRAPGDDPCRAHPGEGQRRGGAQRATQEARQAEARHAIHEGQPTQEEERRADPCHVSPCHHVGVRSFADASFVCPLLRWFRARRTLLSAASAARRSPFCRRSAAPTTATSTSSPTARFARASRRSSIGRPSPSSTSTAS